MTGQAPINGHDNAREATRLEVKKRAHALDWVGKRTAVDSCARGDDRHRRRDPPTRPGYIRRMPLLRN